MELFETKVRYMREIESGKQQKRDDVLLVDTLTFADAEQKTAEYVTPYAYAGEQVKILTIKRTAYNDIFRKEDAPYYYKAKVKMTIFDEQSGAEKEVSLAYLVQANDLADAHTELNKNLKDTISNYSVEAVVETKIIDVITAK